MRRTFCWARTTGECFVYVYSCVVKIVVLHISFVRLVRERVTLVFRISSMVVPFCAIFLSNILPILKCFVFLVYLIQRTSPYNVGLCVLDPRPRALRTHGTAPTLIVSVDPAQPAEESSHRLDLCAVCATPHGRVYQRRRAAVTVSSFEWNVS